MHLSKISLFGFKSFADKVDLSFEPGVTVVVGPNGCGKSNISDAIRWALGEQSAKLLRGDRMDDLIFAGNGKRKPLGLAEVSLTFTRASAALPTEYEEVNVTRRLYRSGESEYLLNKLPCRLRDITDLFIDTGLAGEPYALIEQGSIGSVVNARPAERRVLIEEAAGIMKYKTKKRSAVSKLEATEQNLLRIRDVVTEVERQRNSLKRQANKAERYKQLDLRATELKLFLRYREHLALWEELQGVLAELGPGQETLAGLRAGVAALEATLEQARLQALSDEQAVSAAQEALFSAKSHIDRDEADLRALHQQIEDGIQRGSEVESHLALLGEKTQRLFVDIQAAGDRAAAEEREVFALEATLEEERRQATELSATLAAAEEGLERRRGEAAHEAGQLSLTRTELARLQERRHQLVARVDRLRSERADAATQREGASASSTADAARRETVLDGRARAQAARDAALRAAHRAREARRHLEAEIATLGADVERQRGRLGSLRELEVQFADFSEGGKLLLQAGRDRRLHGILGPLAEALETAPRHEKGLEAILGIHLQGIRVRTWAEAQEALAHLFRSTQGRATLMGPAPTGEDTWGDRVHQELRRRLAELPEPLRSRIEGQALDLVRSPDGAEPWIANLLADAVVVHDLDTALALARELPGPFTLATLAGEVLTHRGALTGGTPAPQGLIGKRRELKELEEALAISEVGLSGLKEALALVSAELAQAEQAAEEAGKAERQAELDLLVIEKDLEARRAEEARLSQQLELFGLELQGLEADLARIEHEIDLLREGIAAKEIAAAGLSARVAHEEGEVARLRETRELATARLSDRRVTLTAKQAARDEILRDLGRMRDELTEAETQVTQLTREAAELAETRVAREAERDRLRDDLAARRLVEAEREAALLAAHEARTATQTAIQAHEETMRARRHDEAELAAAIGGLETRRGEVKTALTLLEQDLAQTHTLSMADLGDRFAASTLEAEAVRTELDELKAKLAELGPANLGALEEYEALCQRHEFLTTQAADLTQSVASLRQAITEINKTIQSLFADTLTAVNEQFDQFWRRLIGGGSAQLKLVETLPGDDGAPVDEEPGVEMLVRFPGKRPTVLSLLSGGERALAALALLLALFAVRPSPFCVLDEVDAPLDDANVERFVTVLREMSAQSQFIAVTHNKQTMEAADILYGITMQEEGVSKVMSVRMKTAAEVAA
jgi:chromosome segregation protein